MFVPTESSRPPTTRERELSQRIAEAIREFQQHYPGTSPAEVRRALRLAEESAGGRRSEAALVTILGGLLVAAGVAFFVLRGVQPFDGSAPWRSVSLLAAAVVVIGLLAGVVARRR